MKYFKEHEFSGWYDQLNPALMVNLDELRHRWGMPIAISPVRGAVGRHKGEDNTSQHNVDKWGEVRAVDTLPHGIKTQEDANRFYRLSRDCGFSGVGFYPQWKPRPGFHLDVRVNSNLLCVATWGQLNSEWISIQAAIAQLAENLKPENQ